MLNKAGYVKCPSEKHKKAPGNAANENEHTGSSLY